jgi:transcription initiation factor TFIIIB Brf1 subunit/transcription initiation factor TFIIB
MSRKLNRCPDCKSDNIIELEDEQECLDCGNIWAILNIKFNKSKKNINKYANNI